MISSPKKLPLAKVANLCKMVNVKDMPIWTKTSQILSLFSLQLKSAVS